MAPLITIISVVYNGVDTLEETIRSVISQSYPNVQFIIIDGGSKDGTLDVIRRYKEHLHYYCSEPDKGIYDAMNKGWAKASPDSYILYLGSGDCILQLPEPDDLHMGDVIFGTTSIGTAVFKSKADSSLKIGNSLHHQSLLVKKQFHPAPPFNIRFRTYADFDFNQRLYKSGARFYHAARFTAYATPGGVSSKIQIREGLRIIRSNYGIGHMLIAFPIYLLIFVVSQVQAGVQKIRKAFPGKRRPKYKVLRPIS